MAVHWPCPALWRPCWRTTKPRGHSRFQQPCNRYTRIRHHRMKAHCLTIFGSGAVERLWPRAQGPNTCRFKRDVGMDSARAIFNRRPMASSRQARQPPDSALQPWRPECKAGCQPRTGTAVFPAGRAMRMLQKTPGGNAESNKKSTGRAQIGHLIEAIVDGANVDAWAPP